MGVQTEVKTASLNKLMIADQSHRRHTFSPTMPRVTSRELAIGELVQWETELRRSFWQRAKNDARASELRDQLLHHPTDSVLTSSSASSMSVDISSLSSLSSLSSSSSSNSSDSGSVSPSSLLPSSTSSATPGSSSSPSTTLTLPSGTFPITEYEDADYRNYRQAVTRIQRFLHFLLTTRVIFPNDVPKFSQLGLVLNLYKAWDSKRFRRNIRVDPSTFDFLLGLIINDPVFISQSNVPQLPVEQQLAITLYRFGHYGSAASVEAIAQWAGCSAGVVVKCTRRVIIAFLPLHNRAIRWPTASEKAEASDWVESVTCRAWRPGFAMVDGTLIPLHAKPGHYGEQFFDRKSNYSLNLQVLLKR